MTTCPKLPTGYNYTHLTQSSDETSVAAYLALQSTKTIFIIRKDVLTQWDFYAKIVSGTTSYADARYSFLNAHISSKFKVQ